MTGPKTAKTGSKLANENVVAMQKSDPALVDEIKILMQRLCSAMNDADSRGITVDFYIERENKANPKSPFTLSRLQITKVL